MPLFKKWKTGTACQLLPTLDAVRSSAIGEDGDISFAGLFKDLTMQPHNGQTRALS